MRPILMTLVSMLALLPGAHALGDEARTSNPREYWAGTKPVVWSLRGGQAPKEIATVSREASARWGVAQTKPAARPLLAEREARARDVRVAPESSTAVAQCWGMKPVMWSHCGEESAEVGAASTRP